MGEPPDTVTKPRNLAKSAAVDVLAGRTTQSEAARKYGISRQAVSQAVARLRERQIVGAGGPEDRLIVDDPMGPAGDGGDEAA